MNLHDVLDRARRSARLDRRAVTIVEDYDPSLPMAIGGQGPAAAGGAEPAQTPPKRPVTAAARSSCTAFSSIPCLRRADGSGQSLPLQIEVIDDGPGLPEHIRSDVFDPFVFGRRTAPVRRR